MSKFLTSVLLLPAVALAQPVTVEKKVICDKRDAVVESLTGSEYKEIPLWFGREQDNNLNVYGLLVNEKTGTWTFIQFNNNVACILGAGEGFQINYTGPKL
jgi:hypothetical protein